VLVSPPKRPQNKHTGMTQAEGGQGGGKPNFGSTEAALGAWDRGDGRQKVKWGARGAKTKVRGGGGERGMRSGGLKAFQGEGGKGGVIRLMGKKYQGEPLKLRKRGERV